MPTRRLPNSRSSVLRTLNTAHDQYVATSVPANRAISAAQFALIDKTDATSVLRRLIKESSEADNALAAQSPLSTVTAQKAARLTMFVSHFHQALDNGIARSKWPAGERVYFGRDAANAVLPDLSSYDKLAEAATAVATGEAARATAEGGSYVAMANPSAAEIATVAAEFTTAWNASKAAQTVTDAELEQAQAVYNEAQPLAVDICDSVEFFYRKDPSAASKRRKCKRWGVVYFYAPGEDDEIQKPVVESVDWNTGTSMLDIDLEGEGVVNVYRSDDGGTAYNLNVSGAATDGDGKFSLGDMASGNYKYKFAWLVDGEEGPQSDPVDATVP